MEAGSANYRLLDPIRVFGREKKKSFVVSGRIKAESDKSGLGLTSSLGYFWSVMATEIRLPVSGQNAAHYRHIFLIRTS